MRPVSAPPAEAIAVHAAPPALRPWCLCAVVRDVRAGPVHARVQASTWASLDVVVQGEIHGPAGRLPDRFLTAPFQAPYETVSPGPSRSICLVLQPWALQPLAGLAAGAVGGQPVAWPVAAGAHLHRIGAALQTTCERGEPAALWTVLAACAPVVAAARPALALDTLAAAGVQAAANGLGCSARQYLRRFRQAMGLAPAAWLRIRRWEAALQAMAGDGADSLADLSLHQGYADQSHLARETRALVAETPLRLRRTLRQHQGPWPLRAAHVRSVQDEREGPA
jgi:AraC-like DNA-binding protein